MDKSRVTSKESVVLKVAKKLTEAQQELDEFAVQLSLGKAEATEKFEEVKKEFASQLTALKQLIKVENTEGVLGELRAKLSELQSELALGKTETKNSFELQRKKIHAAIEAVENVVKVKIVNNPVINEVVSELEKFKLKLEILRLRFALKKFVIKDGFRSEMEEARKKISVTMKAAKEKLSKSKGTYSGIKEEIVEAYQHIRNAVNKI